MMFPETMKGFHVPGIPYASLEFLYEVGSYFGLTEGTVRTALSRMKKALFVDAIPRFAPAGRATPATWAANCRILAIRGSL